MSRWLARERDELSCREVAQILENFLDFPPIIRMDIVVGGAVMSFTDYTSGEDGVEAVCVVGSARFGE